MGHLSRRAGVNAGSSEGEAIGSRIGAAGRAAAPPGLRRYQQTATRLRGKRDDCTMRIALNSAEAGRDASARNRNGR